MVEKLKKPKGSNGGARPGAGRKKGGQNASTVEKQEYLRQFRARIAEEFAPLMTAQIDAAKGVYHILAKGKDGKWIQVTQPEAMAELLDSGEQFYKIHAQNPDQRALKDIFDRLMGMPTQALEVTGADGKDLIPASAMSDDQLKAELLALAGKL